MNRINIIFRMNWIAQEEGVPLGCFNRCSFVSFVLCFSLFSFISYVSRFPLLYSSVLALQGFRATHDFRDFARDARLPRPV